MFEQYINRLSRKSLEIATQLIWNYRVTAGNPDANFYVRYKLFLYFLFCAYLKRFIVHEYNLLKAYLRNYGIEGFRSQYIPTLINKIRNKINKQTNPDSFGLRLAGAAKYSPSNAE